MRQLARAREPDEGAQLEDVVHRREQVGRAADAHRREARQRLVARRLDADPALDVGPDRDRVERHGRRRSCRGHAARPLSDARSARRRAAARRSAARRAPARPPRPRLPGRPSARAAAAIVERALAGSSSSAAASSSASASKSSSSTRRAAPASTSARGVGPLVAGGVRVRDDDDRQAERGHLGQRRRAGPADDQVRGGQRRQHLVAQERVRPVAVAQLRREAPRGRRARPRSPSSPVTWMTVTRSTSRGRALGHGGVEPADGLGAAEDRAARARSAGDVQPRPRRLAVDVGDVADRRARSRSTAPGRGGGKRLRTSPRTRPPGRRRAAPSPARRGRASTLPSHSTTGIRSGAAASEHRDRHVAAGREDRRRAGRAARMAAACGTDAPRRSGSSTRVDVSVDRAQRAQRRAGASGMPGRRHEARLEPAVAAEPASSGASGRARSDRATASAG